MSALRGLRNSFFAGLLVVVPVGASLLILMWVFTQVTDLLLPPVWRDKLLTPLYRVLVLVVFVAVTTLIGWGTRLVLGRKLVALFEGLLGRVPLLNKVFAFVKEVSQTMLSGRKTVFQRVVLVPHPRPGMYSVGFVTSATAGEPAAKAGGETLNVFVPASPPLSGFLVLVPRAQVIDLDMTVAEGMKMVLSGGVVMPPPGAGLKTLEMPTP